MLSLRLARGIGASVRAERLGLADDDARLTGLARAGVGPASSTVRSDRDQSTTAEESCSAPRAERSQRVFAYSFANGMQLVCA